MNERSHTILLVDDFEPLRRGMARALEEAGFTVVDVATAHEALGILESRVQGIRMLISDLHMPAMKGDELLENVRARWPELPVLLISGEESDEPPETFLRKPFTPEVLVQRVRTILEVDS